MTQPKRWSAAVTNHSNALDLEPGVFKGTPPQIARSLKRSAEHSKRRKASPYRSALSMLTFYINRAGKNLSPARRAKLQRAKRELAKLYGKQVTSARGAASSHGSHGARVAARRS